MIVQFGKGVWSNLSNWHLSFTNRQEKPLGDQLEKTPAKTQEKYTMDSRESSLSQQQEKKIGQKWLLNKNKQEKMHKSCIINDYLTKASCEIAAASFKDFLSKGRKSAKNA